MEQQPSPQPQKTVHVRKFAIIGLIIMAVVAIAASLFLVFNPNGIETADDIQDVSIMLTDAETTPRVVHVAKGATITWDNIGSSARHLVISSSQQTLEGFGDEDGILQDESYSFTFDTVGSFTYEDTNEPEKINGTVVVE